MGDSPHSSIATFLSTPSARRATRPVFSNMREAAYFYPRPPRGGRLVIRIIALVSIWISIHALREEGDVRKFGRTTGKEDFYPRPPRGGRPIAPSVPSMFIQISIHALREEGDFCPVISRRPRAYFYPRPPRGGRRLTAGRPRIHQDISIHALREEGDLLHPMMRP